MLAIQAGSEIWTLGGVHMEVKGDICLSSTLAAFLVILEGSLPLLLCRLVVQLITGAYLALLNYHYHMSDVGNIGLHNIRCLIMIL